MSEQTSARYRTVVAMLRHQAETAPDATAFIFLEDGETGEAQISLAALDRRARAIAAWLLDNSAPGERALLLYPAGIEYLAAFFGCLYAGIVAVPAYPPRLNRPSPRIRAIVADAGADLALTTAPILKDIERRFKHAPELAALRWLDTAQIPAGSEHRWRESVILPQSLAYLQYTSGSTSTPKGVMLSHANLMHNLGLLYHSLQIERLFQMNPQGRGVFWLPVYHDMGLIGAILQTIYAGITSVFMSPASFLQRPVRWLQAISQHSGLVSGGPNFAYQYCVDKINEEQCEGLDLSHWKRAICGAEPIQVKTLRCFADKFAPYGFTADAFYPCYGLAEGTLIVSGGQGAGRPTILSVDRKELNRRRVVHKETPHFWDTALRAIPADPDRRDLVACGRTLLDQEIAIVNPDSGRRCRADQVGEIWVAGPSVAAGYWGRPDETAATFGHKPGGGAGPFMRTGDLGFVHDGQLYVTGRIKDLIIIRGRNHYPQDIEQTVEASHPALAPHMGAAFSVEFDDAERLIVVQELKRSHRKADVEEVAAAVRRAVAENHLLQPYAIVLAKPLSVPRTSSGKVKRYACRQKFIDGTLDVIAEWRDRDGEEARPQARNGALPPSRTAADIQQWLTTRLADVLGIRPEKIEVDLPFSHYGLDSAQAVSLSGELEKWLACRLSPTLVWDYPTISQLAAHLATAFPTEGDNRARDGEQRRRAARIRPVNRQAPIAIIGLGCRFPGAPGPEAFWHLLQGGVDAITEVPPDRWNADLFYNEKRAVKGKMNTRWGGFLENVDLFDPYHFGISPREAARIDPQQRLALEVAWEALEHAGQAPGRLAKSRTGVFLGISSYDYARFQFGHPHFIDAYAGTGNAHSIAANRISYVLDLHGPSVAIDTACSSSLVAVHQAAQNLYGGECDLALAGGVNVILNPELTIFFSQARAMAADGRCKAFDERADGYVRSEGCGFIVMKRLDDALEDGDTVMAVLYGMAVNQDGRSNGLTAPNGPAQQDVIRRALQHAGIGGSEITYVEAHGTGTPLGDPIEIQALRSILENERDGGQPYYVGSVKTNVGHMEAAAGIGGLIKTVLTLQHESIPAHLHFQKLNPHIALKDSPLEIPTTAIPWPRDQKPRLAGVSSFGFGGTNAHVIVGDLPHHLSPATVDARQPSESSWNLLPLSGRSAESLHELVRRYARSAEAFAPLPDVAYTGAVGREHQPHRLALVVQSGRQLRENLARLATRDRLNAGRAGRPHVAFLFTGAGSQYAGMGHELYEGNKFFRETIDRCEHLLHPYLDIPLREVLFPGRFAAGDRAPTTAIHKLTYTQPALFALEYALATLWQSWDIGPDLVMGHSTGEYAAACVAGVFSLEDGLRLTAGRGRLMDEVVQAGAMASIFTHVDQVEAAVGAHSDRLVIAAVNGPEHVVVSGANEAIDVVLTEFEKAGIATRKLAVSQAAHSPLIMPMLQPFRALAETVEFNPPEIPLVANVSGRILHHETPGPAHWQRHLQKPVQFAAGMQTLAAEGTNVYLEIGPQPSLLAMGRRCVDAERATHWLPSLRKNRDDMQVMLGSLGKLYEAGAKVDWEGYYAAKKRRKVILPTTPFERERFWFDASRERRQSTDPLSPPDTTPRRLATVIPLYECHTLPAEMTRASEALAAFAAEDLFGPGPHQIQLSHGEAPAGSRPSTLQASITLQGRDVAEVRTYCRRSAEDPWTRIADGRIVAHRTQSTAGNGHVERLNERRQQENQATNAPAAPADGRKSANLFPADDPEEQRKQLSTYLQQTIAGILGLSPDRLPLHQPLDSIGMDSLMAIEVKSRLEEEVDVSLPVARLLEGPTISQLATQIVARLGVTQENIRPVTPDAGPDDQPHPLSYQQQALWFIHQLVPDGLSFNVAAAVRLRGELDVEALEKAFSELCARHAALRLTFRNEQGQPVQRVNNDGRSPFYRVDATAWEEERLHDYLSGEAYLPFDLAEGPIMRLVLLRRSGDESVLLLAMNHIIVDLWSISVMVRELHLLYWAHVEGDVARLSPLALRYTDYVHWQADLVNSETGRRMRDYWQKKLSGALPVLQLPTDRPRPSEQTFAGSTANRRLDRALVDKLKQLGRENGATLYMSLLAAFQTLLYRYSGQQDLLVGSVLAGRDRPELAGLVGYFINPVAMRADFTGSPSFVRFLRQVRRNVLEAVENQYYPLPLLAKELQFHRDPSRPPLFETMFIMQKAQSLNGQSLSALTPGMPDAVLHLDGLTLESIPLPGLPAQFDLTLMVAETEEGLAASLHYNSDLFDAATMNRMLAHFERLLQGAAENPEQPVSAIPLLPDDERDRMLTVWNETAVEYRRSLCLHQLVEAQAARSPTSVAIAGKPAWTYDQLNERAEQLAVRLRRLGVGSETLVGVGLERTPQMLVALLAILKSGGAYVPLDPRFPRERLGLMIEDAAPRLLLTDEANLETLGSFEVPVILCERYGHWRIVKHDAAKPAASGPSPDSLAYVMFTSGSTGRPKGVAIPHRAVVNFLTAMANQPGLCSDDTLLAVTTLSFDISVLELFLPLTVGAQVVLVPGSVAADGRELAALIEDSAATVMQATPTTWQMLLDAGWQGSPHLCKILCGGEALRPSLARRLLDLGLELWNMYGPTETTVWSTMAHVVDAQPPITIGRPLANTQVYILDNQMQPVPIGVPGDLYIGGDGVARGYLNRPQLTRERFLPSPYMPGSRMYRTGDRAIYRPDGNILLLGREDHQVKVRGYRVELGDIEATLAQHPAGQSNVVIIREDKPGEVHLVAYLAGEETVPASELHEFLRHKLPQHMIPTRFVTLKALPATPNGKVDRRALPAPSGARPELRSTYVAPRDELERELADLLAELLGLERVGAHDSFFELGGNSLQATRLIFQVSERLGVQIPLRHLFARPTVVGLSQAVAIARRESGESSYAATGDHKGLFAEMTLADLKRDARLPENIALGDLPPANRLAPGNVLLTGATGFLGAFLLNSLLRRTDAVVHCLVRAKDGTAAMERLRENLARYDLWDGDLASRIVAMPGDLGRKQLGLSEEEHDRLADTIDVIYHNAATINFVYPYQAHKGANILGTERILRLATSRQIKAVHFVSTLSVLHTGERDDGTVYGENVDLEANGVPFGGYAQSKWVAERLVRIAGERGVPVAIYRPGLIAGDSESGITNLTDLISNLGRACLILGAAPSLEGMVDVVPVDYVSEAIVHLSRRRASFGKTFHLANTQRWDYRQMVSFLQDQGFSLKLLSFKTWRERLIALAGQLDTREWAPFLPLLEEADAAQIYMPAFDCQNVHDGLAGSDISCPPVGPELIGRYLHFLAPHSAGDPPDITPNPG